MILDNALIGTLFVSAFAHSLVLWVVFIRSKGSQLSDYENIPIRQCAIMLRPSVTVGEFVRGELNPQPPSCIGSLFAGYYHGVRVLRPLALAPGFFYLVTILAYSVYAGKAQLSDDFNVAVLGHWTLGIGAAFQFIYLLVKALTKVTIYLEVHHPKYKDVGAVWLFTDFYPTVFGYKKQSVELRNAGGGINP